MNLIIFLFLIVFNISKSEENYVRLAVIPEYEQNLVTVLISINKINLDGKKEFGFTLPDDVDSVYFIKKDDNNQISFKPINYRLINDLKWVYILPNQKELAYMIITKRYLNKGRRTFNYQLSFSELIEKLELEIQQPLIGDNFNYQGFSGKVSIEQYGQKFHRKTFSKFPKFEKIDISFNYDNNLGTTTKTEIDNILNTVNKENLNIDENKKKVKRYSLYIWETLIAFFSICIFILIIVMRNNNIFECVKCGYKKRKSDDLFCSNCGEKI